MKTSRYLVSLFALILANPLAHAQWMVIPEQPQELKILEQENIGQFVFDRQEKHWLEKSGKFSLAHSRHISDQEKSRLKDLGYPGRIERNLEMQLQSLSLPGPVDALEKRQWALSNSGGTFNLPIDDIQSIKKDAIAGEDIGINRIPKFIQEDYDTRPSNNIVIAVLDTGIDTQHPDLNNSIYRKSGECQKLAEYKACLKTESSARTCHDRYAKIDTDGNGYPLDCEGWNVLTAVSPHTGIRGDSTIKDQIGHGTHIAGIIAGQRGNGIGIRGVSPKSKLLPVQVLTTAMASLATSDESSFPSPIERDLRQPITLVDIVGRGILYAIRSRVSIIQLSLGWPPAADSPFLRQMIELAVSQGILVVSAAGNSGTDALVRPCELNGVICVGAHDPSGNRAYFSNWGEGVELFAPGFNILSTWPMALRSKKFTDRQGYDFMDGSSMAAPYVSGALAYLMEIGYSANQARIALLSSARSRNLDLSRAILNQKAPFKIRLVNKKATWIDYDSQTPIVAELENIGEPITQINLISNNRNISNQIELPWKTGEKRTVQVTGDLNFESENQSQTISLAFKRSRSFENNRQSPGTQKRPLPTNLPSRYTIKSHSQLFPDGEPSYTIYSKTEQSQSLGFLTWSPEKLAYEHHGMAAFEPGELTLIQEFPRSQGTLKQFAIVSRIIIPNSKVPGFRFDYLDSQMNRWGYGNLKTENEFTVPSEKISWLHTQTGLAKHLSPAWLAAGKIPTLDQPKYDPWNPDPENEIMPRFYYLTPEGLRIVPLKDDESWIATLPQSQEDLTLGRIPVLFRTGTTYVGKNYFSFVEKGQLNRNQKIELSTSTPLEGSLFQEMTYSRGSSAGSQKTWLLERAQGGLSLSNPIKSVPSSRTDSIQNILGYFTNGVFAQSLYDLIWTTPSGIRKSTSLRKYTFVPNQMFYRLFTPVKTCHGPGILFTDELSDLPGSEIWIPETDPKGTGFIKPDSLRIHSNSSCQVLANPVVGPSNQIDHLVLHCGDSLLRVPLCTEVKNDTY